MNEKQNENNITRGWLLTWNPDNWKWDEYEKICAESKQGQHFTESWTCNSKQPRLMDEVFLMKSGKQPRGIIAHGLVVQESHDGTHYDSERAAEGKKSNHITVEFDWIQNVYKNEPMISQDDLKKTYPEQQWSPMGSGIEIKESILTALKNEWFKLVNNFEVDAEEYNKKITKELLLRKQVDQSLLKMGFALPKDVVNKMLSSLHISVARGESQNIDIILDGKVHNARLLCNQANGGYQIRYTEKSELAACLREYFKQIDNWNTANEYVEIYSHSPKILEFKCSNQGKIKGVDAKEKMNEDDGFWPSLEEYNPELTKEDWINFINEIEKPDHPCPMKMLVGMLELDGQASCKQLSEIYGGKPNAYIGCTSSLGRRAKKYFGKAGCMDEGKERIFTLPFQGKRVDNGSGEQYVYRIRPELKAALAEIDLSMFSPIYDEEAIDMNNTELSKNTVLYGPPGTGKTYGTAIYAVAIIENKEIGEVKSEPYDEVFERFIQYKEENLVAFTTFHQSYGYEEFIEGIKPVVKVESEGIGYTIESGVFKEFCVEAKEAPKKNHVFIIDEINRGNISKIFGELITLIEETKRAGMDEEASAILPYSGESFSVPSNVYILGTMNTADRSIALMDTALRRRFEFVEMMPEADVLRDIGADKVDDLDVAKMLEVINERITFLYDREHTIGHAFFTKLAKKPTVDTLKSIFEKSVIPLLQEYFYEDYQKIQLVLGDNGKKDDAHKFILDTEIKVKDIFKGNVDDVIDLPEKKYTINHKAFELIESYKQII